MTTLSNNQQKIARRIDAGTAAEVWRDWKWQVRHAITDISTFERLLGISFGKDERRELEETANRFPLRITPYYLSLIDTKDLWIDPIFMQCFPSPAELQVEPDDMEDPLAEDADHPAATPTGCSFWSATSALCTGGTAPGN
ncbi:hypothetical protein [Methanoculleus receptaculi]|uniref:Lysine 2,3-aminomutase n=1 Tax=Methanoculleus receptaculi TaxID=394967 RepID=A0AAX4FWD6_9EURY|nr:hypothetical protein [Methanoculleus receptaculi]WOX58266.1 hypothetical protein R6Y96_03225 [Methanoculleus receptaculi]